MFFRQIALSVVALSFVACGGNDMIAADVQQDLSSTAQSPIINGSVFTSLPAVGTMTFRKNGQYEENCTGTLIAPRKVITAAHCIDSQGTYQFITGPSIAQAANVYPIVSQ